MVKLFSKIIVGLLLLSSIVIADILPAYVQNIVRNHKIARDDIAIYIKETTKNKIIASYNIDKKMVPASVIKVYSTYASLLELGYGYRWPTKFYYYGKLRNGTLKGDLVIKGFGDPTLKSSDIPHIVSALRARGIKKITGNIVIDHSYFKTIARDSSHFDKNIYSAYNAMPDALMFNQHLSKFTITSRGGKHHVEKMIPGDSYRVSNNIKSVSGSCNGKRSWPRVTVDHSTTTPTLRLSGRLSKACRKRTYTYIITKPHKEFYSALKNEMRRRGIKYSGRLRVGRIPARAKPLYTHYSDRLENIISVTAKKSNNLFARHLLLTLGAKIYGAPSTLEKGRRAVVHILNRYYLLDSPKCHIDNGCGLSRVSRVTARNMARVLDHAYRSYGRRWMNTLSIAGVDGTIKRRFKNTIVKNHAWMKTGTLNSAKNIVGYVESRSGKLYTVVILVNGKRARWHGAALQNEIIKWLIGYRGSGSIVDRDPIVERIKQKNKKLWGDGEINIRTKS
jgi:D-alanyl-D-alanine carboxypeptidase/D-alanyl-D-alanine-endopeptidase (penicillin-binding protein 4)